EPETSEPKSEVLPITPWRIASSGPSHRPHRAPKGAGGAAGAARYYRPAGGPRAPSAGQVRQAPASRTRPRGARVPGRARSAAARRRDLRPCVWSMWETPAMTEKEAPRTRTSRMSGKERREQLLSVGRRVFAEKGFDMTTVEEIAARAKVSKPIVYEHFGGK